MNEIKKTIKMAIRNVSVTYGGNIVLSKVSLIVSEGRWSAIVGKNGAGKSTLLKAMAGLQAIQGEIFLDQEPLEKLTAQARSQKISWLGQNEAANLDLTVWELVMLGRIPHQSLFGSASRLDQKIVTESLQQTNCEHLQTHCLGELSGGERQRVFLARALAVRPSLLLLDEPLISLDIPHQAEWITLMRSLVKNGITIVSVLHEISIALCADEIIIMDKGGIQHHNIAADSQTHAALEAAFNHKISVQKIENHWVALLKTAGQQQEI
jgi:iron complex transport system ATP-binding protein